MCPNWVDCFAIKTRTQLPHRKDQQPPSIPQQRVVSLSLQAVVGCTLAGCILIYLRIKLCRSFTFLLNATWSLSNVVVEDLMQSVKDLNSLSKGYEKYRIQFINFLHFRKVSNWSNLPHSVKSIVGAIYCQNWSTGVSFGNTTIPLENDHLCPDFVIDLCPFVQHLLDVLLELEK